MSYKKPSGAAYKKMRIEKQLKENEVVRNTAKIQTFFNRSLGQLFVIIFSQNKKNNIVLFFYFYKDPSDFQNEIQRVCENPYEVNEIAITADSSMDLGCFLIFVFFSVQLFS